MAACARVFLVTVLAILYARADPACDPRLSVALSGGELLNNGGILAHDGTFYPSGMHWRDEDTGETRGCLCLLRPCLRRCCGPGQAINSTTSECEDVDNDDNFSLDVFSVDLEPLVDLDVNASFVFLNGDPCLNGKYQLTPESDDDAHDDKYFLRRDGTVYLPNQDNVFLDSTRFCVEMWNNGSTLKTYTFPCFPADTDESAIYIMYPVGMLISEPFLLATLLVYAVIPELRNLHGLSLMCHVSSLFTAYLFLAVIQIGRDDLFLGGCIGSAFIIYFSFLASFFWLNVMCLDIWWTFSGFRPMRGSVKEREHKKFIIYSLYCWGSPLIMLCVCMVMDLNKHIPDTYIKPGFGIKKCWFETDIATLVYFFGPIGILVVCNILLFIFTAIKILKLKKETRILKKEESKRHDDDENNTQRFNLYLKLFLVMGVNWVMEVISWAVGGPEALWYLTDIGNTLQGVLIFIIFVWKNRIRRLLMQKFCPKRVIVTTSKSQAAITSTSRISPSRATTMSMMSNKASFRATGEEFRLKPLVTSPSGRSDDSDVP